MIDRNVETVKRQPEPRASANSGTANRAHRSYKMLRVHEIIEKGVLAPLLTTNRPAIEGHVAPCYFRCVALNHGSK
jgi:hypothetical protein